MGGAGKGEVGGGGLTLQFAQKHWRCVFFPAATANVYAADTHTHTHFTLDRFVSRGLLVKLLLSLLAKQTLVSAAGVCVCV